MNVRTPYKKELSVIQMMQDMCAIWNTTLSSVSQQDRSKGRPMMKRILCMAAIASFPDAPMYLLARLTGYSDHTAVSKGLRNGHTYLITEAEEFMIYYRQVPTYFEKYDYNGKYTDRVRLPKLKKGPGPEWMPGKTTLPPFYIPVPIKTTAGGYDVAAWYPVKGVFQSATGIYFRENIKWLKEPKVKDK